MGWQDFSPSISPRESTVQDAGTAGMQAGGMGAQAENQWRSITADLSRFSDMNERALHYAQNYSVADMPSLVERGVLTPEALAPYGDLIVQAQDRQANADHQQLAQGLMAVGSVAVPGLLGLGGAGSAGATGGYFGGITPSAGSGATLGTGAAAGTDALGYFGGITPGVSGSGIGGGAAGAGIGAGAGAMGALGAYNFSYPTFSPTGAETSSAQAPAAGTTSAGGQGLRIPAAETSSVGGAGAAPTGGGAGTAAGAGAGQQSFTDSLIAQMRQNALSLGLMGAGTLASLSAGKPDMPNQAQIQGLGTEAASVANQLISQYKSGTLSPGQQASIDQLTQNTKNQLRQYFASIGQADSTAAAQAMAQVDKEAMVMKQQMLDGALQQGLAAIGVAQGPLNTIAQYQLGQDQQLRQAFGNFALGAGMLAGRSAGSAMPPQTPKAPTHPSQAMQP